MNLESLGAGSITGFITTVFTLLGWNKRIQRLEEEKVDKEFCEKSMCGQTDSIKTIKEDLTYLRGRIDKLLDIAINRRK